MKEVDIKENEEVKVDLELAKVKVIGENERNYFMNYREEVLDEEVEMVEKTSMLPSIEGTLIFCKYWVVVKVYHGRIRRGRMPRVMMPVTIYSQEVPD